MIFTSTFAVPTNKIFERKNLTSQGTPTYRFNSADRADQVSTRGVKPLSISTVGSASLKLLHIGLLFIRNR